MPSENDANQLPGPLPPNHLGSKQCRYLCYRKDDSWVKRARRPGGQAFREIRLWSAGFVVVEVNIQSKGFHEFNDGLLIPALFFRAFWLARSLARSTPFPYFPLLVPTPLPTHPHYQNFLLSRIWKSKGEELEGTRYRKECPPQGARATEGRA